jgi:hypothetical protein
MKSCIIVLLLAAIVTGCGGSNHIFDPPQSTSDVLIPLSSGNKWMYRTILKDEDGKVLVSTIDSSTVNLSTTVIDQKWFFYSALEALAPGDVTLLRNADQGVFQLRENTQTELLTFKYPAKVGEIYTLFADEFSSFSSSVEVVSIDTEITTEKGIFKCYEYHFLTTDGINSTVTMFIAPHIGIVKEVETNAVLTSEGSPDPIVGATLERVLINYTIQ